MTRKQLRAAILVCMEEFEVSLRWNVGMTQARLALLIEALETEAERAWFAEEVATAMRAVTARAVTEEAKGVH